MAEDQGQDQGRGSGGERPDENGAGLPRAGPSGTSPAELFAAQSRQAEQAARTKRQRERQRRERLIAAKEEREAKEAAVVTLVLSGLSYREVGKRMNLGKSQVERLYRSGINRPSDDAPDDFRKLTNARLERLLQAHWLPAVQGDVKATAICLSVIDIMAKFHGQYPAIGIDLTATLTARVESDESEVLRLLAERQADRILTAIPARVVELPSPNGADGAEGNGSEP